MDNLLNETCKAIDIEPEIIPYMIDDEETKVQILSTATGGKVHSSENGSRTIELYQ